MRRTTGCRGFVVGPTRMCELAIALLLNVAPPELLRSRRGLAPASGLSLLPKQDCYRSKVVSLADIPTSHASHKRNYSTSSPAPAPVKCEGPRKGSLHISGVRQQARILGRCDRALQCPLWVKSRHFGMSA